MLTLHILVEFEEKTRFFDLIKILMTQACSYHYHYTLRKLKLLRKISMLEHLIVLQSCLISLEHPILNIN